MRHICSAQAMIRLMLLCAALTAATACCSAGTTPMQCGDYLAQGQSQLRQHLLDFAIDSFSLGLRVAQLPKDAQAVRELQNGLARAYIEAGLFDQADALIKEVAVAYPQDSSILEFLYHKQRGELKLASDAFQSYAAASPPTQETLRAYLDAAELLYKQKRCDEADSLLGCLYNARPEWRGWALYEQAVCTQVYKGDYAGALALYNRMLLEEPKHRLADNARFAAGQLTLIYLNDPAAAKALLGQVLDSKALALGQAAFYSALCTYREKKWEAARDEFRGLRERFPSSRYCSAAKEMEAASSKNLAILSPGQAGGAK